MQNKKIDITPLKKAFAKFCQFHQIYLNEQSELSRAATTQAFEFTLELSWKTMRRFLANQDTIVNSSYSAFRAAALEGLIDDPEIWFEFVDKRNITSHTYEEESAEEVASVFKEFKNQVSLFLGKIEKLI